MNPTEILPNIIYSQPEKLKSVEYNIKINKNNAGYKFCFLLLCVTEYGRLYCICGIRIKRKG